jgi:hypothetical protein
MATRTGCFVLGCSGDGNGTKAGCPMKPVKGDGIGRGRNAGREPLCGEKWRKVKEHKGIRGMTLLLKYLLRNLGRMEVLVRSGRRKQRELPFWQQGRVTQGKYGSRGQMVELSDQKRSSYLGHFGRLNTLLPSAIRFHLSMKDFPFQQSMDVWRIYIYIQSCFLENYLLLLGSLFRFEKPSDSPSRNKL